jgi:hypothetical protein
MNVMELDEAEGLTVDMVHTYLRDAGWTHIAHAVSDLWIKDDQRLHLSGYPDAFSDALELLCESTDPRVFLASINPLARSRVPSRAEIDAHKVSHPDGYWILRKPGGQLLIVYFENHDPPAACSYCPVDLGTHMATGEDCAGMYWPCDAHGNKVRWPKPAPR